MHKFISMTLVAASCLSSTEIGGAQDMTAVCQSMITDAARNISISTSSSQYLDTVFDNYCKSDGSTKQDNSNVGFSAIVNSVPVSLTGGSADSQTAYSNFCRNYQSTFASRNTNIDFQSKVVNFALKSANQCLVIASHGSTLAYQIMDAKTLAINFYIGAGSSLNVRGVSHPKEVTCAGAKTGPIGSGTFLYSEGALPINTHLPNK